MASPRSNHLAPVDSTSDLRLRSDMSMKVKIFFIIPCASTSSKCSSRANRSVGRRQRSRCFLSLCGTYRLGSRIIRARANTGRLYKAVRTPIPVSTWNKIKEDHGSLRRSHTVGSASVRRANERSTWWFELVECSEWEESKARENSVRCMVSYIMKWPPLVKLGVAV